MAVMPMYDIKTPNIEYQKSYVWIVNVPEVGRKIQKMA